MDVRYCTSDYIDAAKLLELQTSMTFGNVYENTHAENLNKVQPALNIFSFGEIYNQQRPHSALGMLSPAFLWKIFHQVNSKNGVKL